MFNSFIVSLLISLAILSVSSSSMVFGPYKDITINMDWNTNVISTSVTGQRTPVVQVLSNSGAKTMTWAFASGSCGSESWAGINSTSLVEANVKQWEAAGLQYIISTGGASGSFKCTSDQGFQTFIQRYQSSALIGFDFDIESGMSQSDIASLVTCIKNAQVKNPKLRFSFTVATFGGSAVPSLGTDGIAVMNAIKSVGLSNYIINLMVMDYGQAIPSNCIVNAATGKCDMGQSAIQAAKSLHEQYGVSYSQIELTPMIGGNDAIDEVFTLTDVDTVTAFALQQKLAGIHYWSLDRDVDCAPGSASATCNSYGQAGTMGFLNRFVADLQLPVPPSSPTAGPVIRPTTSPTSPVVNDDDDDDDDDVDDDDDFTPVYSDDDSTSCSSRCGNNPSCHGCLWTYEGGQTCFPTYPQSACVAAGDAYCWCL